MAINGIPEGFELVEEEVDTKVNIPEGFELVQDETQEASVPEGFELVEEKQPPVEEVVKQPEVDIEAIKKQKALDFKKGRFLMSEIKAKEKFDLTGEVDINLLSEESLNPKKSLLLDYGSQFASTILGLAKGGEEFKTMGNMLAAKYAMDIFKPDLSDKEKALVVQGIKQFGDVGNLGLDKSIEALNKNLRVYETESMIDDFNKGDYGQFTERLVGQTIGAIPSILLTATGWGGIIAQGASSAGSKFSELVEENPDESLERLAFNSLTTGALESAFEIGTRGVLKRAGVLLDRGAKKAAGDLIDNWMTKFSKYLDIPLEGVFEAGTTLSQDLLDALPKSFGGLGKSEGMTMSEYFESKGTAKKMWESFSVGTMMGGGVNLTGALKSNKQLERDKAEYILTPESDKKIIEDAAVNINNLNQQIKEVNNQEDINALEIEITKEEDKIINTKKKVSEELNTMNPDELKAYASNIEKINNEKKKLQSNSVFIREANAQKLVDLELENEALIRESVDRRLDENIKTVGVEDLGRTVNDYDAPSDYQKAYDNTDFGKKNSMNVESSDGFIDTEGDIYINKEVAQKVRNVNVAAHELLHGILNNNIKEPGQLKRLVTEFKAILPRETADLIQKRIDDNYRFTTDEQGNRVERPESEYMEEYFTAFADLIGNRKVKFNENIFTKIGEKITPIFKGKGYGRIKFETGKDVYDFVKSYQKQIAKGELKPETVEAAKKVAKQDIKMSKTASENVQKIYEDQGVGGALDIIEEFKPIVNKIVQRRSEAPNFDRQLLTDEIETGKRGLLELIQDYDVESGVPLAAYINKFLPARAIEASRRVLGESFTEDVSERVDIAAPEVEVEVKTKEEKVPRSLRKKLNIEKGSDLYNKVKDAVVKTFGTKLPEVTDPKFKKALSDSYKRELKKEVNALMGTRSDFKMFVTNNAETLYKSIPQETINKRFQAFSEPVLDKDGKPVREKTAVGKGVFKKKPFNKEEFINYFLGEDVGASTKGTRKTALSETIADEMALDATMEVIEDPKVFEKFKEIQEIEGKKVPKDIKPKISEKVKRPEGFKFSFTTKKDLNWKTDEAGNMNASFNINNKKYNIELYPVDDEGDYRLNFNLETKDGTTQEITGAGDSFKVISTVYNGIVDEIESNPGIKSFQFESDKSEPTRVRLYTTLMNKFADKLGWESDIYESTNWNGTGSFDFELVKPKVNVKFSKNLKNKIKQTQAVVAKTKIAKEKEGINADIERAYGGSLDHSNPNDFKKINNDIINVFAPELGVDIFSYTTPQTIAAAGNNAFGSKPSSGAVGAKFWYVNDLGKVTDVERLGETTSMKEAGYIGDLTELNNTIAKKLNLKIPTPKNRNFLAKSQNLNNLKYNKKNLKEINKEKRNLLNKWKEIYDNFPKSRSSIKELQYNNNANAAVSKNEAFVLDSMDGVTEFNKYEEHGYQHGEYSLDKAKAMSSKIKGVWENWKDYAEKEYKQMVFNKTTRIKSIKDDMRTYQGIVDLTYNLLEYGEWKAKSQKYPLVSEMMNIAMKTGKKSDWNKVPPASDMRFFNEVIKLNPFILKTFFNNKTVSFAEKYKLKVPKKFETDPNVYQLASDLIFQINKTKAGKLTGGLAMNSIEAQKILNDYLKTAPQQQKAANFSKSMLNDSKVLDVQGNLSMQDLLSKAASIDEALNIARDPNAPVKKIRVFDFDDTLATTKSDVLFTAPDGTEGSLTAEKFAMDGARLLEEGYVFDFSEFNKVTKGKPGPLLDIAKKIQAARGTEDVFVLTARAPEAQVAIKEFLDSVGLNIPLENITGLGNSTGEAKANWMVEKAAEGYNDFYFADDAYQNVKAVKDAMSVIDVKSKVQQAKINFSKSVNEDFNKIIEQTTGIASEKVYSEAKAKVRGANKGNKKFFIPYSAEDFMGLIYPLLSKGKLGDSQMAWFKQNLLDPYARAQENLSTDRLQLMEDFKALKKALEVPKDLRKKTDSGFTKEQAVRVYLFNKAGFDVPGISKTDLNELLDLVNSDGVLKAFGDQIFNITKGDGYAKPGENWLVGTITTDLIDVLNTVKRAKYLEQSGYIANAELIFSKENLNKLEAAYGSKYRESVENVLGRMKSGKNRIFSGNRLSNRVLDYINNSTGAIMFFNTRSAVLQTISAINFLNWSFNNPIKAGAAFANQKQYWKDFVELINSDYLVDRRNGLKLNINESEIADAAATSKNKAKAAINYILQKGFLPTQYADSFAIASGGATFYRNRINDLIKNQGMSEADAKKQAMLEWRETAEVSQQSSDPSKISAQQASDLGRVILAFANTPMQYARIQKRAVQDLVKGRGDAKTHVSKIIYYAVVQNLIFNALQSALFGLGFGDDEDDEKKEKMYLRTANGMLDSQLRGLGLAGATVAVIKNFLTDIYERSGRKRPEYVDSIYKLLQISPPISSKISKIRGAAWQFDSKKRRQEMFDKGFSIDNPAYEAGAKVISATANIPLDRVYSKVNNISGAMDEDAETWQTVAMLAGWPQWQIMPKDKTSSELPKFEGRKVKKFSKSNYKNWKKKRYSKR